MPSDCPPVHINNRRKQRYLVLGVVKQIVKAVNTIQPGLGKWTHWGATTQVSTLHSPTSLHGVHEDSSQSSQSLHGLHEDSVRTPWGLQTVFPTVYIGSMWTLCGVLMDSMRTVAICVDSSWSPCRLCEDSMRTL